jgi:hypothetical protein
MKSSARLKVSSPSITTGDGKQMNGAFHHEQKFTILAKVNFRGAIIVFAADPAVSNEEIYYSFINKENEKDTREFRRICFQSFREKTGQKTIPGVFRVVTDQQCIYIFRQSEQGSLFVSRHIPVMETDVRSGMEICSLQPYEGAFAADGKQAVYGEVKVLPFGNLEEGQFEVLLLPDEKNENFNWQFFVYNCSSRNIDLFNIPMDEEGWFDHSANRQMPWVADSSFRLSDSGGSNVPFAGKFSVILYGKQVSERTDPGKKIKRTGKRGLLLLPVCPGNREITTAIVDFGISTEGKIATVNEETACTAIEPCNHAMKFGKGAYLALQNNLQSLSIQNSFRITVWVYLQESVKEDQRIIGGEPGVSSIYESPYIDINSEHKLVIGFGDTSKAIRMETAATAIALKTWTKITLTYDASALFENFRLRVNDRAITLSGKQVRTLPSGAPVSMVGRNRGGFTGLIDRLLIEKTEGTQPVIAGNWKFDLVYYHSSYQSTPDSSDYRNNAVIVSATQVPSSYLVDKCSSGSLQIDGKGLTVFSGMLNFLIPNVSAYVKEGADGLSHLYFNVNEKPLEVAQYNVMPTPEAYEVQWRAVLSSARAKMDKEKMEEKRSSAEGAQSALKISADKHENRMRINKETAITPGSFNLWNYSTPFLQYRAAK